MRFIVEGYPAYAYTGGRAFDPQRPTAVFVHGAAFDHSVWQWQSRYFANHGLSVLAVDLPAHGRSPGNLRRSIPELAQWVAAFIEATCSSPVHLAGHSMGSLIALETALAHPQRLATLALVGTAMPMAVGEPFLAAARDGADAALDMEAVWGHSRNAQLATSTVPGVTLLGASRRLNARAADGVLAADLAACNTYRADPAGLRTALFLRTRRTAWRIGTRRGFADACLADVDHHGRLGVGTVVGAVVGAAPGLIRPRSASFARARFRHSG